MKTIKIISIRPAKTVSITIPDDAQICGVCCTDNNFVKILYLSDGEPPFKEIVVSCLHSDDQYNEERADIDIHGLVVVHDEPLCICTIKPF